MSTPKTFTVQVKRKHIQKGKCGSPSKCAIALALKEQFPGAHAQVGDSTATVYDEIGNRIADFELSKAAERWVVKFDGNPKSVKPANFRLRVF